MSAQRSFVSRSAGAAVLLLILSGWMAARPQQPRSTPTPAASNSSHLSDAEVAATREQLIKLLRISPRLTAVVGRDPSLLANQEYVSRNNPELAQFLQEHPEIVRNPDFYLFAHVGGGRYAGPVLEQSVWPEMGRPWQPDLWDRAFRDVMPFFMVTVFLIALLWLLRVILEDRRWNRMLKLQAEIHGKLLDKFGSNQELLSYMNTESGKRFLESAPIAMGAELATPAKMSLARVLMPLQIGVVLTLVGAGFLSLRGGVPAEGQTFMLVMGTLGLMLGIGFIISAGLAFLLAKHLDLLPRKSDQLVAKEQS